MSGGSYRYASIKEDLNQAIDKKEEFYKMARDMEEKGYSDLAKKVEKLGDFLSDLKEEWKEKHSELYRPMKAFEWWMSGDKSRKTFEEILHDWNKPDINKKFRGSLKLCKEDIVGTKWEEKEVGDSLYIHKPYGTVKAEIQEIKHDREKEMIEFIWIAEVD